MFWKTAIVVGSLAMAAPGISARADITPPNVPANLTVPEGFTPFLIGRAEGTQNYICLPAAKGIVWTFYGPQATLFDEGGGQLTTHFLSANPAEDGTLRATWQDSQDTSRIWAVAAASSTDPAYVADGAIAWLLLRVVGADLGPQLGDRLTGAAYIHRVNTNGGVAPTSGCAHKTDIGRRAFVPYKTDYIFYK